MLFVVANRRRTSRCGGVQTASVSGAAVSSQVATARGDRHELKDQAGQLRLGIATRATRPHGAEPIGDLLLHRW